jgi:hypothetical protein
VFSVAKRNEVRFHKSEITASELSANGQGMISQWIIENEGQWTSNHLVVEMPPRALAVLQLSY